MAKPANTSRSAKTLSTKENEDATLTWWLAAGVVGADIGTSVFYSTSVALPYAGYATPLVIMAVCALMWLFKATYEEGCAISPFNGGAYMTMLQTSGRRWGILAGALTLISYIATAAVSALSAAYYVCSAAGGLRFEVSTVLSVAFTAIILFALLHLRGLKEPARIIFIISAIHFAFLLVLDGWGLVLALSHHTDFSVIFTSINKVTPINFMHGLAVAFLGISGFESAAQIVEQLKRPRWKTLRLVYRVTILLVALTAPLTSALCLSLLSPTELIQYKDSLLCGLAQVEGGKPMLYLLILDAALVLCAAINTGYIGTIGLFTTMARQGDLPVVFLRRSSSQGVQGYPWIVLTFMLLSLVTTSVFASRLDLLGEIYCIAFLAIMLVFSCGIILMRVKLPDKVKRSPVLSKFVLQWGKTDIPVHAIASVIVLTAALLILALTSVVSAGASLVLFASILILMLFYRVGVLEKRVMEMPDLSLGLGRFSNSKELPKLPVYVLCTGGAGAASLINRVITMLQQTHMAAKEIIIFHAEQEDGVVSPNVMFELLQRVVSQQVAPNFKDQDIVLTVKLIPANLSDGLLTLQRTVRFREVFIGVAENPDKSKDFIEDLKQHLGVPIRLLDESQPAIYDEHRDKPET